MPRVKKGRKGRKNGKKSKKQAKDKSRKRVEIELPAPMIDVKVKLEPEDLDTAFTYRDAEKEAEADNDACGHEVMSVSEFVRSVRPELVRDIKPKIEPVIKEEPMDDNLSGSGSIHQVPEIDASNSINEEATNNVILNDTRKKKQPNQKSKNCSICHKSFKDNLGLKQHKYVHNEKTLKCDICDKLFGLKIQFDRHKKIHLVNRNKYPCDICQKGFLTKQGLGIHKRVHDLSRKLFECQICEKKCTTSCGLKGHIQRMHANYEKLKCTFCEKEFVANSTLLVHMRSEHFALLRQQDKGTGDLHELFKGYRTYECYRCKYSTSNRTHIEEHMEKCKGIRIHNHKPIKCELCNRQFEKSFNLWRHLNNMHSIYKRKWKREQMLKEAEKTFECIGCKAGFAKKDGLIQHIRMYCNKRVIKCDYCSVGFPQQIDKIDHHRRVHPILLKTSRDQNYKCHVCKVCIPTRRAIRHLAKEHQIKTGFELNTCL